MEGGLREGFTSNRVVFLKIIRRTWAIKEDAACSVGKVENGFVFGQSSKLVKGLLCEWVQYSLQCLAPRILFFFLNQLTKMLIVNQRFFYVEVKAEENIKHLFQFYTCIKENNYLM